MIDKQNDKSIIPQNCIIDNKQISDKVVIAEEWNKFFSQIGKKTSQNEPNSQKLPDCHPLRNFVANMIHMLTPCKFIVHGT